MKTGERYRIHRIRKLKEVFSNSFLRHKFVIFEVILIPCAPFSFRCFQLLNAFCFSTGRVPRNLKSQSLACYCNLFRPYIRRSRIVVLVLMYTRMFVCVYMSISGVYRSLPGNDGLICATPNLKKTIFLKAGLIYLPVHRFLFTVSW